MIQPQRRPRATLVAIAALLGACTPKGNGASHGPESARAPDVPSSTTTSAPAASSELEAPRVERFGEGNRRLTVYRFSVPAFTIVPNTNEGATPPPGASLRLAVLACDAYAPKPPPPQSRGRGAAPPAPEAAPPATCRLADREELDAPAVRAITSRLHACYALSSWSPSASDLAAATAPLLPKATGTSVIRVRRTHGWHVEPPPAGRPDEENPYKLQPRNSRPEPTTVTSVDFSLGDVTRSLAPYAPTRGELSFYVVALGGALDAPWSRAEAAARAGTRAGWLEASRILATMDASGTEDFVRVLLAYDRATAATLGGDYPHARAALRDVEAGLGDYERTMMSMDRAMDPHLRSSPPRIGADETGLLEKLVGGALTLRDPCASGAR